MDEKCCGNCALFDLMDEYCATLEEEHYPSDNPCGLWENYEDHLGEMKEYYANNPEARERAQLRMIKENLEAEHEFLGWEY